MSSDTPEDSRTLVGASVRSIIEEETHNDPVTSSRSPSKFNFKTSEDPERDYTTLNELEGEGALVNDDQVYDHLLDDTGRFKDNVPLATPIPGTNITEDYFGKVEKVEEALELPTTADTTTSGSTQGKKKKNRKKKKRAQSVTQKVETIEKDRSDADNEVVIVDIVKKDVPSEEGPETVYDAAKDMDNAEVSLDDLIYSHIATLSEFSKDLKTKKSKKKKSKKKSPSPDDVNAKEVLPEHAIISDADQVVPAGVPEGVFSPLVQSRSQSTVRATASPSKPELPHLARGDSYKGTTEFRTGRSAVRSGDLSRVTAGSSDYLRSLSRSRTRLPSADSYRTVNDLTIEGALLNDSSYTNDYHPSHNLTIDHSDLKVVQEDEEEEKTNEPLISKEVEVKKENAKDVSKSIRIEGTEEEEPQDVSIHKDLDDDKEAEVPPETTEIEEEESAELPPEAEEVPIVEASEEKAFETESSKDEETVDIIDDAPVAEEPEEEAIEEEEVIEDEKAIDEEEEAQIKELEDEFEVEDSETPQDTEITDSDKPEFDSEVKISETQDAEGTKSIDQDEVAKEDTTEQEIFDQSLEETESKKIVIDNEDVEGSEDTEDIEVHKVETEENGIIAHSETVTDEAEPEVSESIEANEDVFEEDPMDKGLETVTKAASSLSIHDETERLIKELEDEISESTTDIASTIKVEDGETESTEGLNLSKSSEEVETEGVEKDETQELEESKISEPIETNTETSIPEPQSKDESEEEVKEPKEPEVAEELHEPTKEEIIEMLKDEPVYIYTSLAGGGFHMPQRTNMLVTILTANRIPFTYRDLGTDDEARSVWRRYSNGRMLPGVVRGKDDIIGNWEEIEEANEDYRVRELIYETL